MKNINPHYLALPIAHSVQTGLPLLFSEVFFMEEEIWKEIPGFTDYKVSNLGRVKSNNKGKNLIIKPHPNTGGYLQVDLYENKKKKIYQVHQLVAVAFLGHVIDGIKLVVNHKDFNIKNNNLSNLEIVTSRENCNKKHLNHSSKYTGVSWKKHANMWESFITYKYKKYHLGYFKDEIEASMAYETALIKIKANQWEHQNK